MMRQLLQTIEARLTATLVPATVGKIYLGISGNERQALVSDYDLLIMDAANEDPILGENTSSTEAKIMHVRFDLLRRGLETEDVLIDTLDKWETISDAIYDYNFRRVEAGGVILAETINDFFSVQDGLIGGDDFPLWRTRGATVDYRMAVTRLGTSPY